MKHLIHVVAMACALLGTSCVTAAKQAVVKQPRARFKSIAILETLPPARFDVAHIGGTGSSFGLRGAAGDEITIERQSNLFSLLGDAQRRLLGRRLSDALAIDLRQFGLAVTGVERNADALLDVRYERAGYVALGRDYEPWLFISARLLDPRTQRLLYVGQFSYGADVVLDGVVHFAADRRYRYADFQALGGHADEAARGLTAGVLLVARRIARDLRERSTAVQRPTEPAGAATAGTGALGGDTAGTAALGGGAGATR